MRALLWWLLLTFVAVNVWACDSDTPAPPTTAAPSATAGPPTSTPQPSPTPRSAPLPQPTAEEIAFIERVIALVRADDEAGLIEAARGGFSACEAVHSGPGGGPLCKPGEPEGTRVEAIGESICDGALLRLENAVFLEDARDEPLRVAAYRPSISGGDAGFFEVRFDGRYRMSLSVNERRIFNIGRGCSTAAPLVFGGAVAQWVIPPVYQPFAAEGAFVRVIDEPGAVDPFVWRFPVHRESGGGDYRVYGAESLPGEPAAGAQICVKGWLDDAGNLQAREVTLNMAEQCELRQPVSGVAIIDATIDAVYRRDFAALFDLVDYHTEGCIEMAQLSTPPQCPSGVPVGTPIEVITIVFCDGGPATREEVERSFASFFQTPMELYAVIRPSAPLDDEEYRVIFEIPQTKDLVFLNLTDDGIVGLWGGCGPDSSLRATDGEAIIPAQYER